MDPKTLGYLAAGLGAAFTVIGAGIGIGKLAAAAMEASGRQPEVAGHRCSWLPGLLSNDRGDLC